MEVTYQLTRSDTTKLFRYIRHHRSQMRPFFQCLWLIISLGCFAVSVSVLISSFAAIIAHRNPNVFNLLMFLYGLYVFTTLTYNNVLRPLVVEWQEQRSPQTVSRKTMRLSSEGVSVNDPFGNATVSWPQIAAVVDDQDCIYLFLEKKSPFLEKNKAFAVPKRAFTTSTEAHTFFDAATACWRKAKGIVPPPASDVSGVWPPAPRAGHSQEPGETPKH